MRFFEKNIDFRGRATHDRTIGWKGIRTTSIIAFKTVVTFISCPLLAGSVLYKIPSWKAQNSMDKGRFFYSQNNWIWNHTFPFFATIKNRIPYLFWGDYHVTLPANSMYLSSHCHLYLSHSMFHWKGKGSIDYSWKRLKEEGYDGYKSLIA